MVDVFREDTPRSGIVLEYLEQARHLMQYLGYATAAKYSGSLKVCVCTLQQAGTEF